MSNFEDDTASTMSGSGVSGVKPAEGLSAGDGGTLGVEPPAPPQQLGRQGLIAFLLSTTFSKKVPIFLKLEAYQSNIFPSQCT